MPNLDSGNGGTFKAVVTIPPEFGGASQLVVRLIQQKKNGKVFHEDQWFSNITGAYGTGGRGYNYNNTYYNPNYYNPITTTTMGTGMVVISRRFG